MNNPITPVTLVQASSAKVAPEKVPSSSEASAANKPLIVKPPTDVVQLSTASRVASLSAIGRSVDQIASILGIPVSEVDADLGISATTSSSVSAATTAVAAQH